MILNVNTHDLIRLTTELSVLHRSALPTAVKKTLNYAALNDTKKNTLIKSAKRNFKDERTKLSFFKANSSVDFAQGWNVNSMKSEVGFKSLKPKTDQSVEDLEAQEMGGLISGKAFIPLDSIRTGKKHNRLVQKRYRIADIKNKIVDSKDNKRGTSDAEKWTLSVRHAGVGGFVIGTNENSDGSRFLFEVKKIHEFKKTNRKNKKGLSIGAVPIYSVKKARKVKVKATHFAMEAGMVSHSRISKNYTKFAKEQLEKFK